MLSHIRFRIISINTGKGSERMDCKKVGSLIYGLRKEKGYTQKQLADLMNLSNKTISKWENGLGCPDVSLLSELSNILGVNIEKILEGYLVENSDNGGIMKRISFYVCPSCGNIITSSNEAEPSCCGRKVAALVAKPADEEHILNFEEIDNEYYITFSHPMTKEHYIKFVAYVTSDKLILARLYPEQSGELRLPKIHRGDFYYCCNQHGLWKMAYPQKSK